MPDGWREVFLRQIEKSGGFYKAAEVAGVHPRTAWRLCDADPGFRAAVKEARERHADELEHELEEMGRNNKNPVPHIVRLKALRPAEYIEKQAVLTVSADLGTVDADLGRQLVAEMLQHHCSATRELLGLLQAPPAGPAAPVAMLEQSTGPTKDALTPGSPGARALEGSSG